MYHSITFVSTDIDITTGEPYSKNTWDDWHLIPATRPTLALPQHSQQFVEVPGMDGSYDFSDYLTGKPTFGDRTGNFEFFVDNDHEHWTTIYRDIATFLHGKRYRMILEDDPGFFYEGRFTIASWTPDAANSKISIQYRVGPYKVSRINHGFEDIVWDIFSFEQDNDWYFFKDITVDGNTVTYNLPPLPNPVVVPIDEMPIPGYDYRYMLVAKCIETSSSVNFSFNDQLYNVTQPGQIIYMGPSLLGNNKLVIGNHGRVEINFSYASL